MEHPEIEEKVYRAFISQDLGKVEELIDSLGLNSLSDRGFTLLNKSLLLGRPEIAILLLRKGASIHCKNTPAKTPLHYAAAGNHVEVVQKLLEMGASVNARDLFGQTPLHIAIKILQSKRALQNNYKTIELLLNGCADVNATDTAGGTPLLYAAKLRELKLVQMLVPYCMNINFTSTGGKDGLKGYTSVHCALQRRRTDTFNLLLENGADVNIPTWRKETALHICLDRGYNQIICELLKWDTNMNSEANKEKTRALYIAAQSNSMFRGLLETLVKCKFDVNVTLTCNGVTPLHMCVYKRNVDFCRILLSNGANVNAKMIDGKTALHVASSAEYQCPIEYKCEDDIRKFFTDPRLRTIVRGFCEQMRCEPVVTPLCEQKIVNALINSGADLNVTDDDGNTALHFAAQNARSGRLLIEELINNGAIIPRDIVLKTVLCSFSCDFDLPDSILKNLRLLIDMGADVNGRDNNGWTPLHAAVKLGPEVTLELLKLGSDINAEDGENRTPFEKALKSSNWEVIPCLREHVIKLQAAGLHVSPKNTVAGYSRRVYLYDKYKCEVEAMKNEKIGKTYISYFHILKSVRNLLARFAKSEAVFQGFDVGKIRKKFPNYAYWLELQLTRGLKRASLLESSVEVFSNCIIDLPDLCVDKIFDHLSDDDLVNLVRTRYPHFFPKFTPFKWPNAY